MCSLAILPLNQNKLHRLLRSLLVALPLLLIRRQEHAPKRSRYAGVER